MTEYCLSRCSIADCLVFQKDQPNNVWLIPRPGGKAGKANQPCPGWCCPNSMAGGWVQDRGGCWGAVRACVCPAVRPSSRVRSALSRAAGEQPRVIEAPSSFVFHNVNSYEVEREGRQLVVLDTMAWREVDFAVNQ